MVCFCCRVAGIARLRAFPPLDLPARAGVLGSSMEDAFRFAKEGRARTRNSSGWLHLDVYCLSMLLRVELAGRLSGLAPLTALIEGVF